MTWSRAAVALTLCLGALRAAPAAAHPVPFSYLDLRFGAQSTEATLVVHVFDVAHDLTVDPPERLLDPATLAAQRHAIVRLLTARVTATREGAPPSTITWTDVEALVDRQSIRLRGTLPFGAVPMALDVLMFQYDPVHQTFVNVYEREALTLQAILDGTKTRLAYYPGTPRGRVVVFRRFVFEGARHVAVYPEHVLFLIALVLLGGSRRHLAGIAAAFTLGQAITLAVAAATSLKPPAHVVEPATALSLIYLGADNLMVRGGRDVRLWIALAAGAIHGFGLANDLRAIDLSQAAMRWSMAAFTAGVGLAQVAGALALGWTIAAIHGRFAPAAARVATATSVLAIAAGVVWFVQRVFFPGGAV